MIRASSRPTITIYPGDELRSPIMFCSLATHGLWLRLRLLAHDCERPGILSHLGEPITHELIARRCGTTLEAMLPHLEEITKAGLMVTDSNGFYMIPDVVNHEKKKAEWRRNKGKLSRSTVDKESQENLKRISKESTPLSFSFSSSFSEPSNQKTIAQNPAPQKKEAFMRFWEVYPKKRSKGDAEKAWKSINPGNELIEIILDSVKRAKTSKDWLKEGGKFVPYPATWLRANGWEDEFDVPKSVPVGANGDELRRKILEVQGLLHAEGGVN